MHSSSSTSNSAFSHHMSSNHAISSPLIESRPSLTDARRVSSGIGGSGFGHGSYRDKEDAVPVGFDEGILRGLCEMDVSLDGPDATDGCPDGEGLTEQGSLPLITDRIKQSIASCKVCHACHVFLSHTLLIIHSKWPSSSGREPKSRKSTRDHSPNSCARPGMYMAEQTAKLGEAIMPFTA